MVWIRDRTVYPTTVVFDLVANAVVATNDTHITPETVIFALVENDAAVVSLPVPVPSNEVSVTPATVALRITANTPIVAESLDTTCALSMSSSASILTPFSATVLLETGGSPARSKNIHLVYKKSSDSVYLNYEDRATDGTGYARFSGIMLSTAGVFDFKAEFDGDDTNGDSVSSIIPVTVTDERPKPYLAISSNNTAWSGERFSVTASSNLDDGLTLTLEKLIGATWVTVDSEVMTSRVCTFSAVENAATVPTTVTYRASFAGNIDFAPTTSALLRVSILPTLQTEVAVELSTPQALVGIRYNVNAHISYIDESNSVFPLIDAQVLIYTYVPTPTEPAMLPSYMLTDIVHTDLNGKVTLGFIEQMQLRRFIRVVVPDQTINGTRYNGCTTSPDMVFNVRNPLSLITAPLVGGSVPVMDQVLAAQFAYKQAHQ